MENRQLLAIEFVVALFAWAAIARVFVAPRLAHLDPQRALRVLVAPQMFRIVGVSLLAHNVAAPGLDLDFARWVALGDATTSGLAIAAFAALGTRPRLGLVLAAATTLVGAADLIRNVAMGMRVNAPEYLASGWLIVAIVVPMMLVAHTAAVGHIVRLARQLRSGRN
jgi:hypothetical protein